MAIQTLRFVEPKPEDYTQIGNGRSVSPLLKTPDDYIFLTEYYPGVIAIQELQKRDPRVYGLTAERIEEMAKAGIIPEGEGTLTVVLFPNKDGTLSPRYLTQRGKPLGIKTPYPMKVEGFNVTEGGRHGYEIKVKELSPYDELQEAVEMLKGKEGDLYIAGWRDGLPVAFGTNPDQRFGNARVWIDPRFDDDFGERPLRRGFWGLDSDGWQFDSVLVRRPLLSGWGFRLGRIVDESVTRENSARLKSRIRKSLWRLG